MSRLWFLSILIILSTIAVDLVTFVFPTVPVRPVVVIWFLLVCPGMVLVPVFRFADFTLEWTFSLALSLVIDAGVAAIFLYANAWSPSKILDVLIAFCLAGAMTQVVAVTSPIRSRILKKAHP